MCLCIYDYIKTKTAAESWLLTHALQIKNIVYIPTLIIDSINLRFHNNLYNIVRDWFLCTLLCMLLFYYDLDSSHIHHLSVHNRTHEIKPLTEIKICVNLENMQHIHYGLLG